MKIHWEVPFSDVPRHDVPLQVLLRMSSLLEILRDFESLNIFF